MKTQKFALSTILLLLLLIIVAPVNGKSTESIIVNNADTVRLESFNISQSLLALFDNVEPRISVHYANTLRHIGISELPISLVTLFEQAAERIIIQYANTNREVELSYPVAFFNDNSAPIISGVTTFGCKVTWNTDEYADSTVVYGTSPGSYPEAVTNPLYSKYHETTLLGIIPGTTYYLQISSMDRSGNTTTTSEYSCSALVSVFLPAIVR